VDFSEAFFDNHLFIPLEHSASSKELLDGMIGYDFEDPAWWRRGWVPFTESYGGDHECVDVDAEGGGTPGQVLSFWHDEARRKIKGDSVEAWFGALVDKMEDGRLEWD
jgi:cell wall assembly regulator SMI1